jgi:archaellum component FlaF (FlaF/FlaG flagellin family)
VPDYRAKAQAFIGSLSGAKTATPSTASVLVDGKRVAFQAYEIEENNYFKLRDIAAAVSGSPRQFNVEWDSAQNTIRLISGMAYTKNGSEFVTAGTEGSLSVMQSKSSLLLDGQAVSLTAYTIAGSNYFKLRELGQLLHFDVRWDGALGTILIDTTQDYSMQ